VIRDGSVTGRRGGVWRISATLEEGLELKPYWITDLRIAASAYGVRTAGIEFGFHDRDDESAELGPELSSFGVNVFGSQSAVEALCRFLFGAGLHEETEAPMPMLH
jgi:hypothetical protein